MSKVVNTSSSTANGNSNELSANTVGFLAGLGTFLLVTAVFGLAAFIAMCRFRASSRRKQENQNRREAVKALNQQGTLLLLTPSHSANEGLSNSGYSTCDQIRKSITIKHFMKNGFHLEIDGDSSPPVKRPLSKVNSTPPKIEGSDGEDWQPTANLVISGDSSGGMLLQVGNSHKRAASLRVHKATAEISL